MCIRDRPARTALVTCRPVAFWNGASARASWIEAHYTDWTPISTRWPQFAEEIDESDPWQFENVLAT